MKEIFGNTKRMKYSLHIIYIVSKRIKFSQYFTCTPSSFKCIEIDYLNASEVLVNDFRRVETKIKSTGTTSILKTTASSKLF